MGNTTQINISIKTVKKSLAWAQVREVSSHFEEINAKIHEYAIFVLIPQKRIEWFDKYEWKKQTDTHKQKNFFIFDLVLNVMWYWFQVRTFISLKMFFSRISVQIFCRSHCRVFSSFWFLFNCSFYPMNCCCILSCKCLCATYDYTIHRSIHFSSSGFCHLSQILISRYEVYLCICDATLFICCEFIWMR